MTSQAARFASILTQVKHDEDLAAEVIDVARALSVEHGHIHSVTHCEFPDCSELFVYADGNARVCEIGMDIEGAIANLRQTIDAKIGSAARAA